MQTKYENMTNGMNAFNSTLTYEPFATHVAYHNKNFLLFIDDKNFIFSGCIAHLAMDSYQDI